MENRSRTYFEVPDGIMSPEKSEQIRKADQAEREANDHKLDKLMLQKAQRGEYGPEPQEMAQQCSAHSSPHALRQLRENISQVWDGDRR